MATHLITTDVKPEFPIVPARRFVPIRNDEFNVIDLPNLKIRFFPVHDFCPQQGEIFTREPSHIRMHSFELDPREVSIEDGVALVC